MLGFVAIAPEMFMLLLGEKWMATVPYFEILALSGLFYPLSAVAYNILKVKSDGRVILHLEIVKRIVMTLILAMTIPQGIESVAWGMTAMAAVDFVVNLAAAMRYINIGVGAVVRSLLPQFLLAVAMFGVLYAADAYLSELSYSLHLIADIAIGVLFYAFGAVLFRLSVFKDAWALLRGVMTKSE
jgi:O-antigen/teichoic acid export membrane protein